MLGVGDGGGGGENISADGISSDDVISSWSVSRLFSVSGADWTVGFGLGLSFEGDKGSVISCRSESSSTGEEVSDRLMGFDCRYVVCGCTTGTGAAAALPLLVGTLILGRSFMISFSRYVKDGAGSCAFSSRAESGGVQVRSERRISAVILSKGLVTCISVDNGLSGSASACEGNLDKGGSPHIPRMSSA